MDIGNCTHGFTEEKDPHWNRRDVAGFVSEFEQAAPEVSQREFAREYHIPRTTLQFWIDRKRAINLSPPLAAFFETPSGVDFLHRLLVALHLVFEQDANCGLRRIVRFPELTQLDRVVGSSCGTQYNLGQVVSDQAKALLAHAAAQNAHHSPDLFHVQSVRPEHRGRSRGG